MIACRTLFARVVIKSMLFTKSIGVSKPVGLKRCSGVQKLDGVQKFDGLSLGFEFDFSCGDTKSKVGKTVPQTC
jgi:hypothetical protein